MIPLCLVTGFLGSGKTTFLRQLVRRHAGQRLVFLVNDFGTVDVDARVLRELGPDVLSLPGGSIFCRCLVTQFLGTLRRVAAQLHSPEQPVAGVVIEASGMADPRVVGELLQETGLVAEFSLASVIGLVDPASFHKLLQTLPTVRAQIEACDVALVNKADLHTEDVLVRTEAALRTIQPGLATIRCVHGEVDLALFQGHSQALQVRGELAGCRDPSFLSATVRFGAGHRLDPQAVLARLAAAGDFLWRAKGFLPTAAGWVHLEWTLAGAAVQPAPARTRLAALVLIARGDAQARMDELVAELAQPYELTPRTH